MTLPYEHVLVAVGAFEMHIVTFAIAITKNDEQSR